MRLFKKYFLIFIIPLIFVISGCRGSAPVYHISEDIDFSFYKRVAVMPFDNLTNEKFAGEIVRQVVISELLASGLVDVVLPGDVQRILDELDIKSTSSITTEQVTDIGKTLGVEAVIMGSVEEYGEVKMGNITVPQVTISLMMIDTGSCSIVWSVMQSRGGASFMARYFGARHETISETVLMLVRGAIQTLSNY